ncbi:hypothetical protein EW145_g8296 [Phellinidium pouzarii]|uniref:Ribosomal protein S6 n=1 Tax=Phellinidium pouzarii TaxID=167371 RepID=A0A4S4K8D2_9AGAM|nr:hypothetical protein EW145_g8296 [Phellinidium pouzarii]
MYFARLGISREHGARTTLTTSVRVARMPFYKLFCIAAHYPEYRHIKDLVTQSAKLLLDRGSTVRQIEFLGTRVLPQRMRRHNAYHTTGDYWEMHFDAPPSVLEQLNAHMRTDPRVVRWTMLKLGERLDDVVDDKRRTVVSHAVDVTRLNAPPGSETVMNPVDAATLDTIASHGAEYWKAHGRQRV